MRIALLEDDVDIGSAMLQWLEGAGHTIHHFVSGKAIVREAGRESYDLFILDWHVPDLSRVEALLRRARPKAAETDAVEITPYRIDVVNRLVNFDGNDIEMTDKEYDLTLFLFRNIGRLLSRGHISESVWGRSAEVQSRTVDTHISRIRKKLELGSERGIRLTPVYNFGYRLERVTVADKPAI